MLNCESGLTPFVKIYGEIWLSEHNLSKEKERVMYSSNYKAILSKASDLGNEYPRKNYKFRSIDLQNVIEAKILLQY